MLPNWTDVAKLSERNGRGEPPSHSLMPPWLAVFGVVAVLVFFGIQKEGSRPRVVTVVKRPVVTTIDRRPLVKIVPTPLMAAEAVKDDEIAQLTAQIDEIHSQITQERQYMGYHVGGNENDWAQEAKDNDTRLAVRMDELQRQREVVTLRPVAAAPSANPAPSKQN
jgi:hypothetical protein